MGFKRKILLLIGALFLVTLGQIAFSLWLAALMGRTLQTMSDQVIEDMTGVIKTTEDNLAEANLKVLLADLTALFHSTEGQTRLLSHYFANQARLSQTLPSSFETIDAEVKQFSTSFLRESEAIYNGVGATFEKSAFNVQKPYYVPYAYREDGQGLVYSYDLDAGDADTSKFTDEDWDKLLQTELQEEYYLASAPPKGSTSLPTYQVNWTDPYVDPITRDLLVSSTAPIIDNGKFYGVAFIDLSLQGLSQVLMAIGEKLKSDRIMAFSPKTFKIISIKGADALAPKEQQDPINPKISQIILHNLTELPEGAQVKTLFGDLGEGAAIQSVMKHEGTDYALLIYNLENLLGILAVVPMHKFNASTVKAMDHRKELDTEEKRIVRNNVLTSSSTVFFLAAIVIITVVYIVRTANKLFEVARTLNRESEAIGQMANSTHVQAENLATGSDSLSKALATISSAMREINGLSQSAAESTSACEHAMTKTVEQVGNGTKNVTDMRQAMDGISNATHEISKILKTMEAIAFQTNLLALNAAVEASRAGESGAGFAVVAGEVRNLAGLSSEAAHKTGELLNQALDRAEQGQKVSGSLEASFQGIEHTIVEASTQIQTISLGSSRQINGLDEIASSIMALEEMAGKTQNASKDSIASSQQLSQKASVLTKTAYSLQSLIGGSKNGQIQKDDQTFDA
ncbi:MAG: methyl-accepting chemotaxis protein [Deltaproteobacteria bacterium]|nr:methyl-accepting chemotaxis protein [Deltaproteobacteria bacterium]